MKNLVLSLALIFILSITSEAYAQVYTRILGTDEQIQDIIPWHISQSPLAKTLSPPNVQAVLSQDAVNGVMDRFAIKNKVNLTKEDGEFYEFGNYSIWKITVSAPGATYLNLSFENLHLPPESQMIAYSDHFSVLHGPITTDKYRNSSYVTESIAGDQVTVEVFLPAEVSERFQLEINNIYYGIAKTAGGPVAKAYGDAQTCSPDIRCTEGNGWQLQADATCIIFRDFTNDHCSGTLVTDECHTNTPFILTALHCIDGNGENPANLRFRFNYRNQACGGNVEPSNWIFITFDGAITRATSTNTDGALLELFDEIPQDEDIVFAGWDRSGTIPPETTIIHHPAGDVMKISFDASSPTLLTIDQPFNGRPDPITSGDGFRLTVLDDPQDFGILEGGSSGSAHYDDNQRIYAIHSGGFTADCQISAGKFSGRFSSFWTGNGTPATRLSDWLGGGTANTTDAHPSTRIDGHFVVCSNDNYEIENFAPGSSFS